MKSRLPLTKHPLSAYVPWNNSDGINFISIDNKILFAQKNFLKSLRYPKQLIYFRKNNPFLIQRVSFLSI
jgi:hypothetical protein